MSTFYMSLFVVVVVVVVAVVVVVVVVGGGGKRTKETDVFGDVVAAGRIELFVVLLLEGVEKARRRDERAALTEGTGAVKRKRECACAGAGAGAGACAGAGARMP